MRFFLPALLLSIVAAAQAEDVVYLIKSNGPAASVQYQLRDGTPTYLTPDVIEVPKSKITDLDTLLKAGGSKANHYITAPTPGSDRYTAHVLPPGITQMRSIGGGGPFPYILLPKVKPTPTPRPRPGQWVPSPSKLDLPAYRTR